MEFYSILNLDIQFSCLGVYCTYLGELVVTILEFEFGSVQLVLENIAASISELREKRPLVLCNIFMNFFIHSVN